MALDNYYHNKIEAMQLEILKGQAVLRRLEAQRNDYNSRVRLLREELGLLQQPGSYVGEVVKVMSTKKVLVKVHPEGKYGMLEIHLPASPQEARPRGADSLSFQLSMLQTRSTLPSSQSANA
jgi:ATP-dependent 26S proteasome regulatory subunit